ncbi:MAG: tRNA(m5U54)methyltransferase [Alyxoria varia]|nr:MAG: tRNA(m5U54)methyltransferase [Alyxoria varia]
MSSPDTVNNGGQKNSFKRAFQGQQKTNNKRFKKQKGKDSARTVGSHEEVLEADIRSLLRERRGGPVNDENASDVASAEVEKEQIPERFSEVEVEIENLSSTGDGLGFLFRKHDDSTSDKLTSPHSKDSRVYVVPFTVPGDIALARVVHHNDSRNTSGGPITSNLLSSHTLCDYLRILTPSPQRDDSLVRCRYFTTCSGCQFQHLPYTQQLTHKQTIYTRAYTNFSSLPASAIPAIQPTIGSPLQYGYRTKLTPHFDGPPGSMNRGARRRGEVKGFEKTPEIGFMRKGGKRGVTVDIEQCVIGTEAVGKGLTKERERVGRELERYKKGATLLLRESTVRVPKRKGEDGAANQRRIGADVKVEGTDEAATEENAQAPQANGDSSHTTSNVKLAPDEPQTDSAAPTNDPTATYEDPGHSLPYLLRKTCITDPKGTSTEYVGNYIFENPANSFFQNNTSILPRFTQYIQDHVLRPPERIENAVDAASSTENHREGGDDNHTQPRAAEDSKITNLIDAYSGSGLFSLTLSPLFTRTLGIDISADSITSAKRNLALNNLSPHSNNTSQTNDPTASNPTHNRENATSSSSTEKTPRNIDFVSADASSLFSHPAITGTSSSASHIPGSTNSPSDGFNPRNTAVILDPPRKGCDLNFLRQLRDFGPQRVVYVSCNVHTQARDVGWLVGEASATRDEGMTGDVMLDEEEGQRVGEENEGVREEGQTTETGGEKGVRRREGEEKKVPRYEIESLQPFDFFPQTAHVEGVAVLNRVD